MALYRNIAGTGGGKIGRELQSATFDRYYTDGGDSGGFERAPVTNDVVFYDPWHVASDQGSPSEEMVQQVRNDEPVIPIQQLTPMQSMDVQTMTDTDTEITTTVDVPNQADAKNLFPLLTLAFVVATMVKGESFFGGKQRIVFAGGLGLLYYQLHKRAAISAP